MLMLSIMLMRILMMLMLMLVLTRPPTARRLRRHATSTNVISLEMIVKGNEIT